MHFKIAKEEKLDIDKEKLMDVLVNILTNSIKFSKEHGKISIGVSNVE
jgi:signal transduction histidine kinase